MKKVSFTKMHGLGNDFIVIDLFSQELEIPSHIIRKWSGFKTGIGFDQLLLLSPHTAYDALYQIFNSDGSEVEQCGNGARCVAKYLWDRKLVSSRKMTLLSRTHTIPLYYENDDHIIVSMGKGDIVQKDYSMVYDKEIIIGTLVNIPNPHWIVFVKKFDLDKLLEIGQYSQMHFKGGMNVSFVEEVRENNLSIRTYERGVGFTFACGSAASAAAVAYDQYDQPINVSSTFGSLTITVDKNQEVTMNGPAREVFQGEVILDETETVS